MDYKDYYKILGVQRTALPDEIKKAYRKLAQQYHPDRNQGDKIAEEKFKEINEAYEVLGNEEHRKKYNRLGASWKNFQSGGGRSDDFNWNEWSTQSSKKKQPSRMDEFFSNSGGNYSDFFENMFGKSGFSKTRQKSAQAKEASVSISLTLEEAFKGKTVKISVGSESIDVKIKPGIADGQKLKISPNIPDISAIYITVTVLPDSIYKRNGADIEVEAPLDLYTAVLGGETEFKTLHGTIKTKISAGTQSGAMKKLKSLGMPKHGLEGEFGDLYVRFLVMIPADLSSKEKDLFEKLRKLRK